MGITNKRMNKPLILLLPPTTGILMIKQKNYKASKVQNDSQKMSCNSQKFIMSQMAKTTLHHAYLVYAHHTIFLCTKSELQTKKLDTL